LKDGKGAILVSVHLGDGGFGCASMKKPGRTGRMCPGCWRRAELHYWVNL